jgi:hypothetical protein
MMQSERDPAEHFAWPPFKDIWKHAFIWAAKRGSARLYGKRQVLRVLALLESLGIILPMHRWRYGRVRPGWIVTRHPLVPPEAKTCFLPDRTGLTYRTATKRLKSYAPAQKPLPVEKPLNVTRPKPNVTPNVTHLKGFVTPQNGVCDTQCDTSGKAQPSEIQPDKADGQGVSAEVSRALTLLNLGELLFFASEKRSKEGQEPGATAAPQAAFPLPESLKAEEPERAKAKAFFEVKREVQKYPLSTFGQVVVHFANEGLSELSEITKMSLEFCKKHRPGLAVPDDPAGFVKDILRRKCGNG